MGHIHPPALGSPHIAPQRRLSHSHTHPLPSPQRSLVFSSAFHRVQLGSYSWLETIPLQYCNSCPSSSQQTVITLILTLPPRGVSQPLLSLPLHLLPTVLKIKAPWKENLKDQLQRERAARDPKEVAGVLLAILHFTQTCSRTTWQRRRAKRTGLPGRWWRKLGATLFVFIVDLQHEACLQKPMPLGHPVLDQGRRNSTAVHYLGLKFQLRMPMLVLPLPLLPRRTIWKLEP